jgi:septum formation inhibitor MinC
LRKPSPDASRSNTVVVAITDGTAGQQMSRLEAARLQRQLQDAKLSSLGVGSVQSAALASALRSKKSRLLSCGQSNLAANGNARDTDTVATIPVVTNCILEMHVRSDYRLATSAASPTGPPASATRSYNG